MSTTVKTRTAPDGKKWRIARAHGGYRIDCMVEGRWMPGSTIYPYMAGAVAKFDQVTGADQ